MIIIATCLAYPEGNADLRALADALGADSLPWQLIEPSSCVGKVVLPLAVWDYSEQPDKYLQWLQTLDEIGAKVVNSPTLQRWNIDKRYLLTLAEAKLPVTPTMILSADNASNWHAIIDSNIWNNPVIKPLIGQSGKGVRRLADACTELLDYPHGALVQPFVQSIFGEVCLVYFQGVFSHAIRRIGKDWRKNSAYGAYPESIVAEKAWLAIGEAVLEQLPEQPIYARIDGLINEQHQFILNEVELIEPALYFSPTAFQRFQTIIRAL